MKLDREFLSTRRVETYIVTAKYLPFPTAAIIGKLAVLKSGPIPEGALRNFRFKFDVKIITRGILLKAR